jgi:hypothetical protein
MRALIWQFGRAFKKILIEIASIDEQFKHTEP